MRQNIFFCVTEGTRIKSSTDNSVASNEPDENRQESAVVSDAQGKLDGEKSSTESVFLQAAKWLLDRKALKVWKHIFTYYFS